MPSTLSDIYAQLTKDCEPDIPFKLKGFAINSAMYERLKEQVATHEPADPTAMPKFCGLEIVIDESIPYGEMKPLWHLKTLPALKTTSYSQPTRTST